jgi:RND family efflux transporter MFP subunit
MTANVDVREFPNEQFRATVVRTSSALDPATRTLRTELHIPNPEGRLMPGMYVQVRFAVDNRHGAMVIPANTLVIDSTGVGVVTVDSQSRIARKSVRLGRDFGREVEVVSGLTPNAKLVVSPRDDVADGESVILVEPSALAGASRR